MATAGGSVGESALILPVPAAEPLVGHWRGRLDRSAAAGVPAHITVLYPFLAPRVVDAALLDKLRELAATSERLRFQLTGPRWFADAVVWLEPTPREPVERLIRRAMQLFPEYPRYGRSDQEVIPHLTIGDSGGLAALREAEAALQPLLPLMAEAKELQLITRSHGRWTVRARLPLGTNRRR